MNWPVENGEGLQILNYKVGGEYKPHFDYFPPGDPGSAVHLAKGGQRVSTMVIYLNDVEEAGETTFPDVGLSVTPKKGAAVYFEYCNSQNQVDPLTLHAGAPWQRGRNGSPPSGCASADTADAIPSVQRSDSSRSISTVSASAMASSCAFSSARSSVLGT